MVAVCVLAWLYGRFLSLKMSGIFVDVLRIVFWLGLCCIFLADLVPIIRASNDFDLVVSNVVRYVVIVVIVVFCGKNWRDIKLLLRSSKN